VEVVASLSQGRTAAAQCGLFTHKSVPVIFEPPCTIMLREKILASALLWGLLRTTSNGGILLAAMAKCEGQISEKVKSDRNLCM